MKKFFDIMAYVFTTLGVTLLIASVFLVPSGAVLADDGTGGVGQEGGCSGVICSDKCEDPTECFANARLEKCVDTANATKGCKCNAAVGPGDDCSGCKCKYGTNPMSGEYVCRCNQVP
jgi:hypothetical protein